MSEKYLGNMLHVAVSVEFGVWEGGEGRIILTWKSGMSGALLGGASQPKVFGFPKSAFWVEVEVGPGWQVERQTALAISCPAPEVWQSQCGGGLSMGQQCDRCGGIDRWDDEARGGGSTRGGALGPTGGCYSYSLQVGEENQSLSTIQ